MAAARLQTSCRETGIAWAQKTFSRTLYGRVQDRQQKTRRSGFPVPARGDYAPWMFEACLPFGPVVTSKLTFWPSLSVLKPCMVIAEKCANRSSPPSSGVMKPWHFESLNHLTVPVAMLLPSAGLGNGIHPMLALQ